MFLQNRKAFTMLELVFVIVIIGILAAIAIPKFDGVSKLAYMSKGKNTLAIVRTALATEKQKNILKGTYANLIIDNAAGRVFTRFTDENGTRILDNDLPDCTSIGCWHTTNDVDYTFYRDGSTCTYKLESNRFVDKTSSPGCTELED